MEQVKTFEEYRAEKLGYIYFSRLNNLIISQAKSDSILFDYLIDIADKQKQTGRIFGVEVKDVIDQKRVKELLKEYTHIAFPALLVFFDNQTDKGFYKWIQKPKEGGRLELDVRKEIHELDQDSLTAIVKRIEEWYGERTAA